jgi:hypothetical protein
MASTSRLVETVNKPLNARATLRLAAAVALGATAIQFVVWLMIVLISRHLENPWWMWTLLTAGILAGIGQLLNGPPDAARQPAETDKRGAQ